MTIISTSTWIFSLLMLRDAIRLNEKMTQVYAVTCLYSFYSVYSVRPSIGSSMSKRHRFSIWKYFLEHVIVPTMSKFFLYILYPKTNVY